MIVLRVIVNALIMAAELGAIAAVAWIGWQFPYWFAAATATLALLLGLNLDYLRLKHEYPFYFEGSQPRFLIGLRALATGDSIIKAIVAGLVALLTFSGSDDERRLIIAICFAVAVFAGTSLLRRLSMTFGASPARWGFFRLAVPLGLVFSTGVAVAAAFQYVKTATLTDIGRQLVFDMPARPSIEQVSDLLFNLKQYVDSVIATLLTTIMPADWAQVASLVISVNVLTGFIVALYALVVAESVRWIERRVAV
ncbi:MAG: hypothetical protein KJ622_12925 [Alphaproteobacteria bacterium]|nr:hypothetical protein [Alphaproteobacteria bacterium]